MSLYKAIDQLFESEMLKEADRNSRFAKLETSIKRNRERNLKEDFIERNFADDIVCAVEDGFLSWEAVARAALHYMSEDDLKDMASSEDWGIADDEDFDDLGDEDMEGDK